MTSPESPATPERISREAARADHVEIIRLYEMTLKDRDILRFTPDAPNGLTFGGERYDAFSGTVSGLVYDPNGARQHPQVTLSNQSGIYYNDLFQGLTAGQRFTRIVTFASECDPPVGSGGGSSFTPETWRIERSHRVDNLEAVLDLVPEADFQGASLPSRVMLRDLCQHRYRVWDGDAQAFDYTRATCPYIGSHNFDEDGNPVTADEDQCSLKLETGCKKRFSGALPFLGFPGIGGA